MYSIAFDPKQTGNVYAAGNNVYKSTDSGNTWSQITPSGPGFPSFAPPLTLVVDSAAAGNLFAIAFEGPVAWSPDGGDSWFPISNGLAKTVPIGGNGTISVIANTQPEILYVPSSVVGLVSLTLQH